MEIFVVVKKLLLLLGYFPFNHPNKARLNIYSKILCFGSIVPVFMTSFCFFLYGTKSFAEQTESFFNFNISFFLFLGYFILLLRRRMLLELVERLECTIYKRKYRRQPHAVQINGINIQ